MVDFSNLTITRIEEEGNYGVFRISPLPRGYGHTVANSLRRIMLSSLEGGAITAVKIAGVDHEYSAIDGVQDDVLRLILQLKTVAVRCYADEPVTARINVKSKKGESVTITTDDIEVDASVEIVDTGMPITTISDGAELSAEIVIEKGTGYAIASADKRKEIGVIPVDGVFSPIENVEINVSNARVGQRTDFEQVVLKIDTNGVVTPTESIRSATEIMRGLASILVDLAAGDMEPIVTEEEVEDYEDPESTVETVLVSSLELSTRLKNALTNSAITDLQALSGKSKDELLEIRGMGQKSVDELITVMKEHNIEVIE